MPTTRQRTTFKELLENGGSIGGAMIKAKYSPATAKSPQKITQSKGWAQLLAEIDDDELLRKVRDIALDNDKRAALQAIDMVMKLKDKYPAGKLKVQEYNDELERLKES